MFYVYVCLQQDDIRQIYVCLQQDDIRQRVSDSYLYFSSIRMHCFDLPCQCKSNWDTCESLCLSLSPPTPVAHTKAHTYAGACVDGEQSRTSLSFSFTFTLHPQVVATETVGTIFLGASPLATALLEQGANVDGAGKLQWVFTDSISLDSSFSFSYPRGILALVPASRYIVEFEDHWVGWAVGH